MTTGSFTKQHVSIQMDCKRLSHGADKFWKHHFSCSVLSSQSVNELGREEALLLPLYFCAVNLIRVCLT